MEKLVEKILGKLEMATNSIVEQSSALLNNENSKQTIETDQPKLF